LVIASGQYQHTITIAMLRGFWMPGFFTVKWPRPACLEAFLLFAASLLICGKSVALRWVFGPLLTVGSHDLGLSQDLLFWVLAALVVKSGDG
jgi:hypothetical protein